MSDDVRLLAADDLARRAVDATGLGDFGPDTWQPGLGALCDGLNAERVLPAGRMRLAREIRGHLENRLRVVDWHRQHPELASTRIESPIVILGLPRTGTTVLSYLLDQDPENRSLLNWEATNSAPPAPAGERRTDPRCLELLEFQRAIVDHIDPPPPHWEWADGPTECTFLLAQDFKTVMWDSRAPNAPYHEFLDSADLTSAYDWHRSVLQVLGSTTGGRWCLKMPAHALFIDELLAAYPDARIVWTHRDPLRSTASFLNLQAFSHGLTVAEPDLDWIRDTCVDRLVEQVERPMRTLDGRDVHHVFYDRWMADPLAEMDRLYDWLGTPLTPTVRTAMAGWLDADPLEVSRRSSAKLEDFGVAPAALRERFADYIETFDLDVRI